MAGRAEAVQQHDGERAVTDDARGEPGDCGALALHARTITRSGFRLQAAVTARALVGDGRVTGFGAVMAAELVAVVDGIDDVLRLGTAFGGLLAERLEPVLAFL